jgi:hypothetical protein
MTKKTEGNKRARSLDSSVLPSSKKLHQEKIERLQNPAQPITE